MSTEELMKQINEKDKAIADLKEKTKAYILKMQTQHQEALASQQEITKETQEKVEKAKVYINKLREENTKNIEEIENLRRVNHELTFSNETKVKELEDNLQNLQSEIVRLETTNRESINSNQELEASLRAQISSLEKSLSESGDQTSVRLNELETKLSTTTIEKQRLESEIESLRSEIVRLETTNRESINSNQELEASLRAQISSLEKSLSESGDQTSVRLNELETKLSTTTTEKQRLESEIESLRSEIVRLETTNRESINSNQELEASLRAQISSLEKSLSESGDQTSVRLNELESSFSTLVNEKRTWEMERDTLRSAIISKTEQITSLIQQLKELETTHETLTSTLQSQLLSIETLSHEKDNLEKRLEKAKEYFNTKRLEDEIKLNEIENLKNLKLQLEKKLNLCLEECVGLKNEISRLVSEITSREESYQRELHEVLEENTKLKTVLENERVELKLCKKSIHDLKEDIDRSDSIQQQITDLTNELTEKNQLLQDKEMEFHQQQQDWDTTRQNYELELSKSRQMITTLQEKTAILGSNFENLENELNEKKSEINILEQNMNASNLQCSTLQKQNENLKLNLERVSTELENEILQNQDRKKKIRVYVDKLTADKTKLEEQLGEKQQIILNLTKDRDGFIQQMIELNNKLEAVREQGALQNDSLRREFEDNRKQYLNEIQIGKEEILRLQEQVKDFERLNAEKMLHTQELLNVSNQELESHKSKRLAARSEMIGLAQAHEKIQADHAELRDYIRYTLIPLVFDQVSGVETALQQIEMVSNMLLSKRLIKMTVTVKPITNTATRTQQQQQHQHQPEIEMNSIELNGSNSPTHHENDKKSLIKKKKESDGMEQALILKAELDRVLSGVKLLGDTVDRLNLIVRNESRCCGGVFDTIWISLLGSSSALRSGGTSQQGDYSSLRLDDSTHG